MPTLLGLAACNTPSGSGGSEWRIGQLSVIHRQCNVIPTTGINVTTSGLSTTVFGHPISLGSATFGETAIQKAGQELQILAYIVAFDCSLLLGQNPPNELLIDRIQAQLTNLSTLTAQLSAATNDQQVIAAVATAQNTANANKAQTAAGPPPSAGTAPAGAAAGTAPAGAAAGTAPAGAAAGTAPAAAAVGTAPAGTIPAPPPSATAVVNAAKAAIDAVAAVNKSEKAK
jgi:hypothetical protein